MINHISSSPLRQSGCRLLIAVLVWLALTPARTPAAEPLPATEPQRIFVPADALEAVFQKDRIGAILTLAEYERLLRAARDAAQQQPGLTAEPVASQATTRARIEEGQLLAEVTVACQSFRDGSELSLRCGGWHVESALVDGKPARLTRAGERREQLKFLLEKAGTHQLELRLSAPLLQRENQQAAHVTPLGASAEEFRLTTIDGTEVSVNNMKLPRPQVSGGLSEYIIPVGGLENLSLLIAPPGEHIGTDSLQFVHSQLGVHVSPGEVTWTARCTLQTFGPPLSEIQAQLPAALEIIKVEADELLRWEVAAPDDQGWRKITFHFQQAFNGSRVIQLQGLLKNGNTTGWQVPGIRFPSMVAHTGEILLEYPQTMRLQFVEEEGVRPVAGTRLSYGPTDPLQATYQFWKEDFTLKFTPILKEQQVQAVLTTLLNVNRQGVDLAATATLQSPLAQLFEARLRFPAEYAVVSVAVNGTPAVWSKSSDMAGVNEIRIPLTTGVSPSERFLLQFQAHLDPEGWPVQESPVRLMLPEVRLMQASLVEALYGITSESDLEVVPLELTGLDPAPAAEVRTLNQQVAAESRSLRAAFSYQEPGFKGQLDVLRKKPLLSVDSITFFRVDRESEFCDFEARLNVQGGSLPRLQVRTSEAIGDRLRFNLKPAGPQASLVRIVEQTSAEVADGLRTWTLGFDRELQGEYLLETEVRVPREASALEFSPPKFLFPQAASQSGFVAVGGGADEFVRITAHQADGGPLLTVDPVDFPPVADLPKEKIVAGYRVIQGDWNIVVATTLFDRAAIPTAIGHRADLVSVLGVSGDSQHHWQLTFSASGTQSLSVRLPEGARLWATSIDDVPVEARETASGIRLPLSQLGEGQHLLNVFYSTALPPLTHRGRIDASVPGITAVTGSGTEQPVEILQQQWQVHYPDQIELVGSTGVFQPQPVLDNCVGFSCIRKTFAVPSPRQLKSNLLRLLLVGLLVGAIAYLATWCKRRSGRCLTFRRVFLIGVPLVLVGLALFLSSVRRHSESAVKMIPNVVTRDEAENWETLNGLKPSAPASAPKPPLETPASAQYDLEQKSKDERPFISQAPSPAPVSAPEGNAPHAGERGQFRNRLSLTMNLTIPSQTRMQTFSYAGDSGTEASHRLEISYLSRASARLLLMTIALGGALLGWWLRSAGSSVTLLWCLATFLVPVALAPLLPAFGQLVLQGIFLGGILGTLTWGLSGLFNCCRWLGLRLGCCCTLVMVVLPGVCSADEKAVPQQPYVIVPYKSFSEIAAPERILVPAALYQQLWEAAHPEPLVLTDPSLRGTVSEVNYAVRIVPAAVGVQAEIGIRCVLSSLSVELQEIQLPFTKMTLTEARLDGGPASVINGPDGKLLLQLAAAGVHILDLKATVPVDGEPSQGQFQLELLPVPAGILSFEAPQDGLLVRANGAALRSVTSQPRTSVLPIEAGGKLDLSWRRLQSGDSPTLIQGDTAIAVVVSDGGLELNHQFTLRRRQGAFHEAWIDLPSGAAIRQVFGPDLLNWSVEPQGERKRLHAQFQNSVDEETSLVLQLFQPADLNGGEPLSLKFAGAEGLSGEAGQIGLFAGEAFTITSTPTAGLQQINVASLSKELLEQAPAATPPLFAYRFSSRPIELRLSATRREVDLRCTAEHGLQLVHRRQNIASRLQLQIGNLPQRLIQISLPAGYQIRDVVCGGGTDWFVRPDGTRQRLTIELNWPRSGALEIGLDGYIHQSREDGTLELEVPSLLESNRQTATVGIWFDETSQPVLLNAGHWRAVNADTVAPAILRLRSQPPKFAFTTTAVPDPLQFQLEKVTPSLTADAGILIAAGDTTVDYGLTLRWNIATAASDTFVFTAPAWLTNMEVTGEGIRQVLPTEVAGGRTRWQISLSEPVKGNFLATAVATVPFPSDLRIQTPLIEVESQSTNGEYRPLETQRQFAALVNLSANQLAPENREQLETISADELPLTMPPHLVQQAMDIVRVRTNRLPVWKAQHVEAASGTHGVVLSAALKTVLARDGSWRTEAVYTIRNRGRQFLGLQLPAEAKVLSVQVRGALSRAVTTKIGDTPIQLISLPQTSQADLSYPVAVLLAGRLSSPLPTGWISWGEKFPIPAPQVVSQVDSPEYGLPVAQTHWSVYVPEDFEASPVQRKLQTNLNWHTDSITLKEQRSYEQLKADVNELTRVLSTSSSSPTVRLQARNNLKNLEQTVRQLEQSGGISGSGRADRADESRKLLEQAEEALARDEEGGAVSGQFVPGQSGVQNRGFIASQNSLLSDLNKSQSDGAQNPETNFSSFFGATDARRLTRKQSGQAEQSRLQRSEIHQQIQSFNRPPIPTAGDELSIVAAPGGGAGLPLAVPQDPVSSRERLREEEAATSPNAETVPSASQESLRWTSAGGLSLAMTLPVEGRELSFSKVGGQPQLTLDVRPRWARLHLMTMVWSLAVITLGLVMWRRRRQAGTCCTAITTILWLMLLVGTAGTLLLPSGSNWLPAVIVLISGSILACGAGLNKGTACPTPNSPTSA
ncbi:hypothetical protein [Planctomicrobium sp. SH664]|uniref:hypothetical protein n=1 Tax=Planctomicrobium sp. SH664 TaxID=3448125 RepID=UPI003F5C9FFA